MQINVTYDASVAGAPAGFKTAVEAAVAYYEDNYTAPITVNITIGWGTASGTTIPDGALGATQPSGFLLTYDEARNALWRDATTPDALTAAMALPATDPTGGGTFFITSAEAKALGLIAGDDSGTDGIITLDTTSQYTFDPDNRAVPGEVDAIGVLEHEIGHVLGRVSYLGYAEPDGSNTYGVLDLFRYAAPGVLSPSAVNASFSIDGQNLLLPFNNPLNGGDADDWSINLTGDAYDAFGDEGIQEQISPTDVTMLDTFGYHPLQPTPATPVPSTTPSDEIDFGLAEYDVASGQSVYFTWDSGKSYLWGLVGQDVVNNGTITAIIGPSDQASEDTALRTGGNFTNAGSLYVLASGVNTAANGADIFNPGAPLTVTNSGLVQVVSQDGDATGIHISATDVPAATVTNLASGSIGVVSSQDGTGLVLGSRTNVANAGLIDVTAQHAIGVKGAYTIDNSGTIRATDTGDGTDSAAIALYASDEGVDSFINSGLIQGNYGFYANLNYSYSLALSITNSGIIVGDNFLGDSDVTIHNTGIMAGNLFLGNSTNVYDGAGGKLYGTLYLGIGNDTITLGSTDGVVFGGGGTASITGGAGNDFFLIPRGDATIDGGGGFNILSFDNADAAVTADLGAGTASAGGSDTLNNIQEVIGGAYANVLKAGASGATLVGGAGANTLTGGSGADTLVAGSGGTTATGGGGSDTFIYSAGDNQLTVTDFGGGADVLKICGYAAALSVQQQGADTLITLSATDSILLKNVLPSALTGSNVKYSAYDYAPLLPFSPPGFGSSTIFVDSPLTIHAGETIEETARDIGVVDGLSAFDNGGNLSVDYTDPTANSPVYGFAYAFLDKNGRQNLQTAGTTISLTNEAGASFSVTNSAGEATGFQISPDTDVVNAGHIAVTAAAIAAGLTTDSAFSTFTNKATGTINIASQGDALAFDIVNGAGFENDGAITVSGGAQVYGRQADAYGIRMGRAERETIVNNGTITVTAAAGGQAYGIAVAGLDTPDAFVPGQAEIDNTGTITAANAIYVYPGDTTTPVFPRVHITNSGTIDGDITLATATEDQIHNSGAINGIIRLGDGNTVYDGASGTLDGGLYLGDATNTVTLGNDGETVIGSASGGLDTVTGGSGDDIIAIARGVNTLDGGGGTNILSFAGADAGVQVDLGAGTASGTGADTISNFQEVIGSGFNDTLKAGATAATLIGGAGHDTLVGGAGKDTLVAGSGGGTATGNGGKDIFLYSAGDHQLTVTDFGTGADVLKIYGYTAAMSVQQQGADTLITLSATDSILLKNVLTSALTGGNLIYNSGSYSSNPPSLALPPLFGLSEIDFTYDLTIYAGEHIAIQGPLGLEDDARPGTAVSPDHSLDNGGAVSVSSPSGNVTGLEILPTDQTAGGTFTNEQGATFSVSAPGGDATGMFAGATSPSVVNAGSFLVSAQGTAMGADIWETSTQYSITNAATGLVSVMSTQGDATGFKLENGTTVENDGSIAVSGVTNAYGLVLVAHETSLTNTGTITASGAGQTYGVYLDTGTDEATIANSGTITAKTAIYATTDDLDFYTHNITLTNTGTINGDIDLGLSNQDQIISTGTINGNILIHDYYTTVDLRGGHFTGAISIAPTVDGSFVNDTIYTGDNSATIRIQGGNSAITAAIHGNGKNIVQFDVAAAAATWSYNGDGSWSVSAGVDGSETLFGVNALQFTDKTVVLVNPISGGSGNDVLTGGPGNDVLRGGSGTNVLDGGAGIDTAAFAFAPVDYYVTANSDGSYTVEGPSENGAGGSLVDDTLTNIEQASFDATGQTLTLAQFAAQSFNPLEYIASNPDLLAAYGDNQALGLQHFLLHGYYEGRGQGSFNALQYVASNPNLIASIGDNQNAALENYILTGYGQHRPTTTFNPLEYIASNPDLIASIGDNQTAALENYILTGYGQGRPTTSFNALEYTASNPDLIRYFGDSQTPALEHYILHGYSEHRNTTSFNALEYVASNPGLIASIGDNQTAALEHYILHGYAEHRPTTSFNPLEYIASNPDLIASIGDNQTAALENYILTGYGQGRPTTSFNALEYIASNTDLIQYIGDNQTAALEHYLLHGYSEHRQTTSFNALEYTASNTDLIQYIGDNQTAALEHYILHGYSEHRQTASFNALQYIASNPDLIASLGDNQTAALEEYIQQGFGQGRPTTSFNPLEYLASNPDLLAGYGDNPTLALEHYILHGYSEHRQIASFDAVAYLLSNPDLENGYLTAQGALQHYVDHGFKEGRSASGAFGTEQTQHALTLGTSLSDTIGTSGDEDWFSVTLTAGQSYNLSLSGADSGSGTLADPRLELHNATGVLLASDNDSGPGKDALISFTATSTGLYYLVAASNTAGATGTYKILAAGA